MFIQKTVQNPGQNSSVIMYPSSWCFYTLLLLLSCVHVAHSIYYRQLYSQRWGNRGPGRTRSSTELPRVSDHPSQGARTIRKDPGGAVSRGQYYNRLVGRLQRNRGLPKKGELSPSPSLSPASSTDMPIPPEIAAMIPPGGTINDIPKSQLAVLTGDPEYTRFRQLFLREMCRRLLNGPRSELFQLCLSIMTLQ